MKLRNFRGGPASRDSWRIGRVKPGQDGHGIHSLQTFSLTSQWITLNLFGIVFPTIHQLWPLISLCVVPSSLRGPVIFPVFSL